MIDTPRLTLRPPEMGDLDGFAAFYAESRASFVGGPVPARDDAWRLFLGLAGMWHLRGYGPFTILLEDEAIGHGGPWWPAGGTEPELGWALWRPELEGRGLMHEAMTVARAFAWGMGLTGLVSYIHPANRRSRGLAKRLGAVRDARSLAAEPGVEVWRHPRPDAHGSHTDRTASAHRPEAAR